MEYNQDIATPWLVLAAVGQMLMSSRPYADSSHVLPTGGADKEAFDGFYGGKVAFGVPMGIPSLICLLHLVNKALVVWCADPKIADQLIPVLDLGLLAVMGGLGGCAAFGGPAMASLLPVVVEMGLAEMILETVYNGIYRGKMRTAIWVHHIAAIAAYGWCMKMQNARLMRSASMLTMTELSSAFPVAFNLAHSSNQLKGQRAAVLGGGMGLAFIARTACAVAFVGPVTWDVGANGLVSYVGPFGVLGLLGANVLVGLNAFWTAKIFQGIAKQFSKPKVAGGQAVARAT